MCNCERNMNQWRVRFFLLFTLLVAVSELCSGIDGQRSATTSMDTNVWASLMGTDDEELTESNFLYVVHSKGGKPCILTNMEINVTIPLKTGKVNVTVPANAAVKGTCKPTISELMLSWTMEPGKFTQNNTIRFTFINDHTNFSVFSIDVEIYHSNASKNPFKASSDIDLHLFAASATKGIHSCDDQTTVKVGDGEVTIWNVSLIAFNTDKKIPSRTEEKCDGKDNTKTFPYVLRNDDGNICTLARMSISLEIAYKTKDSQMKSAVMQVPNDARVIGMCVATYHEMQLVWSEKSEEQSILSLNETDNEIQFSFVWDGKNAFLNKILIDIHMDERNFPDSEATNERIVAIMGQGDNLFLTAAKNGIYSCANNTILKGMNQNVKLTISDTLLVAFNDQNDFALKNVADCNHILSEDSFNYVVRNSKTDVPCILANMTIEIRVPYKINNISDKTGTSTKIATLHVPLDAKVSGTCQSKSSVMELNWTETEAKDLVNKISFHIGRNATTFMVSQIEVDIYKEEKNFPDATNEEQAFDGMTYTLALFPALADNGLYNCSRAQKVQADDIEIILSNVSYIAFNTEENLNSRNVTNCNPSNDADSTTESTAEPSTTPSTTPTDPPNKPSPETTTNPTSTSSKPNPSVKKFNYHVIDPKTNAACIVANMSITMIIPYKAENSEEKTGKLNVPLAAKTSGDCNAGIMRLTWLPNSNDKSKYETGEENEVTFNFKKDETTYSLDSVHVHVYMDDTNFPGVAGNKKFEDTAKDLKQFSTNLKNLYQCAPESSIKGEQFEMIVKDVALMVFNEKETVTWKSVENCVSEDTDAETNVGAIVGGVIGGVIVVAVIIFAIVMYRKKRRFR